MTVNWLFPYIFWQQIIELWKQQMEIITILAKYYNNANQSYITAEHYYIILCFLFYTLNLNVMYAFSKYRKLYAINITHQISPLTFITVFFVYIFTLVITKYQQSPKPIYLLHHISCIASSHCWLPTLASLLILISIVLLVS